MQFPDVPTFPQSKILFINEYPELTVEDILTKAIPAYNDLIDGTKLDTKWAGYKLTSLTANQVLREISGRDMVFVIARISELNAKLSVRGRPF